MPTECFRHGKEWRQASNILAMVNTPCALILRELGENSKACCIFCHRYINGPTYCCWDCNIFLHKSCAELPLKTKHPAHPDHPALSLTPIFAGIHSPPFTTEFGDPIPDFYKYRCDDCSFSLDVELVAHLKEEEEKEMIQHFADDHPLTPFNLNVRVNVICRVCQDMISGPIYGCPACGFYLHESCAQLPREIEQHPFHPQHRLTLFPEEKYSCNVCHTLPEILWCGYFVYKCSECPFNLDVRCASLEPSDDQQEDCGAMKRFSHQHQLAPFSMKMENPRIRCKSCDLYISGEVYGCPDCKFFLHKSCPRAQSVEGPPSAKHQPHEHDLTYFGIDCSNLIRCSYCGGKCSADSYRCAECNFNVHYDCIRTLPLSIKHDCHFHPLVLRDKFVQYHDEHYCDACEKTRRPDRGVYYCAQCNFAAHIGCVISSVKIEEKRPAELRKLRDEISSLKAEVEEMETNIAAMQMNLGALKKKLKEFTVKRDDLACGEDEEGPNMEVHIT